MDGQDPHSATRLVKGDDRAVLKLRPVLSDRRDHGCFKMIGQDIMRTDLNDARSGCARQAAPTHLERHALLLGGDVRALTHKRGVCEQRKTLLTDAPISGERWDPLAVGVTQAFVAVARSAAPRFGWHALSNAKGVSACGETPNHARRRLRACQPALASAPLRISACQA